MVGTAPRTAWTRGRLWGESGGAIIGATPMTKFEVDAAPTAPLPARDRPAHPPAEGSSWGSTGFGPTLFEQPAAPAAPPSVFDVCHVGVVLRTLLFVHGVLAAGLLFEVPTPTAWLSGIATGAAVAMPAVLLWLLAACGLKRTLGRLPIAGQWIAAIALGAVSASVGALLAGPLGREVLGAHPLLAPAVAGACMAAAVFFWLRLRAQALLPAETAARLAELQSRIRPHFLFNTLNTAIALVRVDPGRAEQVLEDLSELFRVALIESGHKVTVAEEIELARRYLEIEQIRFGDRLQVSWDLDEAAGAARVPPLVLQPLVENAVRHGVEPAPQGGWVRIRTRCRRGQALVSVTNSLPPQPLRGQSRGHGIALRNVKERLRLMHDVAADFAAGPEGQTWRVQIAVPLA